MGIKLVVTNRELEQIEADALIALLPMHGRWETGLDNDIQSCAGNLFHGQAEILLNTDKTLKPGDVILTKSGKSVNTCPFSNIIFVLDDYASSLGGMVKSGLEEAIKHGFTKVVIPPQRTGSYSQYGNTPTTEGRVLSLSAGLRTFAEEQGEIDLKIVLTINGDSTYGQLLIDQFK